MPELPEVEAVVRTLRPLVVGQRITACRVVHSIAVRPQSPGRVARACRGDHIEAVERRGKYLVLRLTGGCLVLHFRLDGQIFWLDAPARGPFRVPRGVHVDVLLCLEAGALGFADRRHFGRVHWYRVLEECPGVSRLGMDPLDPAFTWRRLYSLLRGTRRPLKLFLLDQARIAGLGNIYSSESLWRARLAPRRRSHLLSEKEARRLHKAIVYVLRRALECCLDPPPDLRKPDWWFRGLEEILRVYGREGEPCARCRGRRGSAIRRIAQGGRSSFFCPRCQH